MKRECECQLHCDHRKSEGKLATSVLFPGILLTCLEGDSAEPFGTPDYVLQIRCCRQGRVGWRFPDGRELCLGKGDLAIHTVETWKGSERFLPEDGGCDGFILHMDLKKLTEQPPELFTGTDITGEFLFDRFCAGRRLQVQKGSDRTESIFAGFYQGQDGYRTCWQRVKMMELLLYLLTEERPGEDEIPDYGKEYPPEQIQIIQEIHEQLIAHMDKRITIEELSRQHLINPTTLKAVFKAVYGTSLAAHMKEHRMGMAAKLLRETTLMRVRANLQRRSRSISGCCRRSIATSKNQEVTGVVRKIVRKTLKIQEE